MNVPKILTEQAKILIADDNVVNVKVISGSLAELGYDLLTVNNGDRAVKVAKFAKPDLILLDVNMPVLNGFEACKILKETEETKDIPVIFLTALDDIDNKIEGFELGGVDYITKPFNKKEVIIRVETQLRIYQLNKALEIKNKQLNSTLAELLQVQDKLKKVNKDLIDSIQYSQRIQNAILPDKEVLEQMFPNSFIIYKPKHLVSGDFYWFKKLDKHAVFIVADCTGHGVPGAFMSVIGISAIKNVVESKNILDPGALLTAIDHEVISMLNIYEMDNPFDHSDTIKDGMDVSVVIFDLNTNIMKTSSALRPTYIIMDGELNEIKGTRQPIGFSYYPKTEYETHTIQLHKGDIIYLFSDGYPDQFGGERNRKFTLRKFKNLILSNTHEDFNQKKQEIINQFRNWKGDEEQTDDVTILGIQV